nr:retrovirus-related Pol polyprotein from transposon TNT 1-94 [Tanacetum cinerariifolium]
MEIKIRSLLIQYGCEVALEVLPADMEAQAKADLNKKAHSTVILCLGNTVLREVTRETTTAEVWSKLETLYMTKSLANKLYLKKKLYKFYIPAGQNISEHIDEFKKIVLDLANIKNTLAEYMILSSADNRPPMLDKDLTKKYAELSVAKKIQADYDMKATNIILQGLPADIYSLVNHHKVAKDLWERVQLLMQGTSLTKQERECKLLPLEWSKFVTDVKLVKDLHTSNYDQLHAYLEQHELYANEVRLMRERNQDPLAFIANQQMTPPHFNTYQSSYNNPQLQQQFSPSKQGPILPHQHYSSHYLSQTQFNHSSIPPSHSFQSHVNHQTSTVPQVTYQSPQAPTQLMTESPFVDSGFAVLVFSLVDDPIACLNKAMAFLTAVASSRFSSTNNQLITSSNARNQATIQDGRVTVQQVQGRQGKNYSGTTYKGKATSSRGNTTSGQARVVKFYNCQGEGHMSRQCTQPKRQRNGAWYKEKAMLAEAQEVGKYWMRSNSYFLQIQEDLDTFDFDYDDLSNTQAVLMANISNYGSDVISEETVQDTNLQAQQDLMILSMIEQIREKMIDSQMDDMIKEKLALKEKVDSLEQKLSKQITEKECLLETFNVFKNKSKSKENKYMETEIDLEEKIKKLNNIVFKVGQSAQTVHMLTKPQSFYDNVHKQALELSAEQAFWLHISNPTIESSLPPVKVEVPSKLPKRSKFCEKCLNLDAESSKSKQAYNDLLNKYLQLEKHCISLEVSIQLKQEIFQNNECCVCQNAPDIPEYFEKNDLKAQLKDNDTTICKLKDTIKSLRKNDKEEIVDHDRCDLAT